MSKKLFLVLHALKILLEALTSSHWSLASSDRPTIEQYNSLTAPFGNFVFLPVGLLHTLHVFVSNIITSDVSTRDWLAFASLSSPKAFGIRLLPR